MDVWWGYNNIRIKEGDEWKATFHTSSGLYELTVMFFGLCNSPATFQAFMNKIFADLIREGVVKVYMDDIWTQLRNTGRSTEGCSERTSYISNQRSVSLRRARLIFLE
jgi:hypothetical protein